MADKTAIREVWVTNAQGLHARPASMFVELASQFQSRVELIKDSERVDGKSILSVLTLAAVQGTRLLIRAEGEDAEEAVEALARLFAAGFDNAPQQRQAKRGDPAMGGGTLSEGGSGNGPGSSVTSEEVGSSRDADQPNALT